MFTAACAVTDDAADGESDRFVFGDGKADTGGIQEGTPDALGVLQVANTLTQAQLKSQVGLASAAATNIAAYRKGDDETAGTSDDEQFDTLRELDSIPFVGPVAFGKLLAYAQAHGFTTNPAPATSTSDDPFDPTACQGAPMSQTAATARWQQNGLLGSYQLAIRERSCPNGDSSCGAWQAVDLGTVSWRTQADGELKLAKYNDSIKLQTVHGLCNDLTSPSQLVVGSVCDGVGHTLYCGTYGLPGRCDNEFAPELEPYKLPNQMSFALQGKLTENCAQLGASTNTLWGNTVEVALLVRF
jgi:hypothetical protein